MDSPSILSICVNSLKDYPNLKEYEILSVLMAARISDPEINSTDDGVCDCRISIFVKQILSIVHTDEEVNPAWLAIVRYANRIAKTVKCGIEDISMVYHRNENVISSRSCRKLSDKLLEKITAPLLSAICSNGDADISDLERYFELKYRKLSLPEWVDSPSMVQEYTKTREFLIEYNSTFWNYVNSYITDGRLII